MAGVVTAVSEFIIGHEIDSLHYDKSPQAYPDHFRAEYRKVEVHINIFSSEEATAKKLEAVEERLAQKDSIIGSLVEDKKALENRVERMERMMMNFERVLNQQPGATTIQAEEQKQAAWKEHLKQHPELQLSVEDTADPVKLEQFLKAYKGFQEQKITA